jgi:hypothetical protein
VNLTFRADIISGDISAEPDDDRVEAVELIQPERLKGLDLRPPITGAILSALERAAEDGAYVGSVFTAD